LKDIILFILILSVFSCNKNKIKSERQPDKSNKIAFADVPQFENFYINKKGTLIVKSDEEWNNLGERYWNHYSGNGSKTPAPGIDFKNIMVIGIFWGANYSGCSNRVEVIKAIEIDEDKIIVTIDDLPSLGPCDMIVTPLQMVSLPKSDIPVIFKGNVPSD